jgi:hypothetical protein
MEHRINVRAARYASRGIRMIAAIAASMQGQKNTESGHEM